MTKEISSVIEQNNDNLKKRHLADMKDFARAMENDEKDIVLKTTPTEVLLNELSRRLLLLENRDKAIKDLFHISEE